MAIKLELTTGLGTCFVHFDDCDDLYDVGEPRFTDKSMRFPWNAIPNKAGHMPHGIDITVKDFLYKADVLGYKCKVISK